MTIFDVQLFKNFDNLFAHAFPLGVTPKYHALVLATLRPALLLRSAFDPCLAECEW